MFVSSFRTDEGYHRMWYLPTMEMSRRQFFRGLTGKDRAAAIDAFVRTNLLPYDFSLTGEQIEQLLGTVRSKLTGGKGTDFSSEERQFFRSAL